MNRKQKINEYKKVRDQLLKIKEDMNNVLANIMNKEGSLNNYELWIDKKFKNILTTDYKITIKIKELEKEGCSSNIAYLIEKNDKEAEKIEAETDKI